MKQSNGTELNFMQTPPNSRRNSLHDVARAAGVSASAVSYVVNGRTDEVSAKTLLRIKSAIKTLKYQPQRRGRSLKFNREFAIGFVIFDTNPNFLADPFTTQVASGLGDALEEPGYGLTVSGCKSHDDLQKLLARPIGVDAFVVIASGSNDSRRKTYHLLSEVNLPMVIIQENVPEDIADACAILQNDKAGAQLLTKHLVEGGCKDFLFVAPSRNWPAIQRREQGILAALPKGLNYSKIECDEEDFGKTVDVIGRYLATSPRPDAIMGANDQIAIAALRVLNSRGVEVPKSIQVTGYNDFVFRNYTTPILTTVTSCTNQIGHSAAEVILARLASGSFAERKIIFDVKINIGDSTSILQNGS